jgi:hypothetical protein
MMQPRSRRRTTPSEHAGGQGSAAAEARARCKAGYVPAEEVRYNQRSSAEGVNGRLKDEFGARNIWVRGDAKCSAT